MSAYIVRRLLQAIPTIFGVTILTFFLVMNSEADPINIMLFDPGITADQRDQLRTQLCLDRSQVIQYAVWMVGDFTGNCPTRGNGLLRGDMGNSFFYRDQPVLELYWQRIGPTLRLTTGALILGSSIGLFIGIMSAIYRGSFLDNFFRFLSVLFDAIPNFWLGIILIFIFGVWLGWLPTGRMVPLHEENPSLIDQIRHLILPTIVLGVGWIAVMSRYMRAETLEVMNQEYIRTAHAKGLTSRKVYFKHAARNALIPIVTILGPAITTLVSGAVVVERIFTWPGMGRFLLEALFRRDFPVVMGSTVIVAILVVAGNLLSDILLVIVDPRVRL